MGITQWKIASRWNSWPTKTNMLLFTTATPNTKVVYIWVCMWLGVVSRTDTNTNMYLKEIGLRAQVNRTILSLYDHLMSTRIFTLIMNLHFYIHTSTRNHEGGDNILEPGFANYLVLITCSKPRRNMLAIKITMQYLAILFQCLGGFLGVITLNFGVSKSNWLHDDILPFSLLIWSIFSKFRHKRSVISLKSWTSTGYCSNSTGSSVTSGWFSPFIAFFMAQYSTLVTLVRWYSYYIINSSSQASRR